MDHNWLTPKAQARPIGAKGWGSFALETIAAGETVAGFGGFVVPGEVLLTIEDDRRGRSIQIDDDLFLVSAPEPEPGDMVNHSCDPNCGIVGGTLVVAMRDIPAGEELTFDYAMCDSADYDEFPCECGATTCRGIVTCDDWKRSDLRERYAGWFSAYLARRIAALPVH